MTTIAPFDFDPNGGMAISADGPEVLAISGVNDVPIWKQFTEGVQVGVKVIGSEVATVDTDGWVIYWRLIDGARLRETRLEQPTRSLARGRKKGELIAIHDDGVSLLTAAGDATFMPCDGARAAAFGDAYLLIGTTTGVAVWNADTGEDLGRVSLSDEVTAVAHSAVAGFVVAAGAALYFVEETTKPVPADPDAPPDAPPPPPLKVWEATLTLPAGGPTREMTISSDGVIAAVTAGPQQVSLFELVNKTSVGQVMSDLEITGLGFGPQAVLGVGYDDCRANRVDLFTKRIHRTQVGMGRTPTPWNAQVTVNDGAIRGAKAAAQAGGQDIASWVQPTSFLDADPVTGKRSPMVWVALVFAVTAMSCGCCGCCGGWYFW